jgi:hypothetical protein
VAIAEYEGQEAGTPWVPPPPLVASRSPLLQRGRYPPHAARSLGTSGGDGLTTNGAGYRMMAEVEALANAEADNGWTLLATTVDEEVCTDVEILQAYQDPNITVAGL